jgi:hypothetical protein
MGLSGGPGPFLLYVWAGSGGSGGPVLGGVISGHFQGGFWPKGALGRVSHPGQEFFRGTPPMVSFGLDSWVLGGSPEGSPGRGVPRGAILADFGDFPEF